MTLVFLTSGHSDAQPWASAVSVRVLRCQKLQMTA